jgi:hypothetical protein
VAAQSLPPAGDGSTIARAVPCVWLHRVSAPAPAISGPSSAACAANAGQPKPRRPRPINWPQCSTTGSRRNPPSGNGVLSFRGRKIRSVRCDNYASKPSTWDSIECLKRARSIQARSKRIEKQKNLSPFIQAEQDVHPRSKGLRYLFTDQAVRPPHHWWRWPRV